MDDAALSAAPAPSGFLGIAGAIVAAALVVALGVAVPLQVTSLKKEKAEATAVPPLIHVQRPPEYGVASWYGDHEAGKLTASGEVFRPQELTAAHRWLPLGTKVRVTRLGTKRSTVVTINDRGPYVGGRLIDLSPAAARKLAMVDRGLARVRIDVISEPSPAVRMVKRAVRKAHPLPRHEMAEKPPRHEKSDKQAAEAKAKPHASPAKEEAAASESDSASSKARWRPRRRRRTRSPRRPSWTTCPTIPDRRRSAQRFRRSRMSSS